MADRSRVTKVCHHCAQSEDQHWIRHFKRVDHYGIAIEILKDDMVPQKPFYTDWFDRLPVEI